METLENNTIGKWILVDQKAFYLDFELIETTKFCKIGFQRSDF